MALSSGELDRIADELYLQRRITGSVYCGNCGYNLRTLPYIYTCPECGSHYNARPLKMKGIFLPYESEPPIGDGAGAVLCGVAAVLLLYHAIARADTGLLLVSVIVITMLLVFSIKFLRRLMRFLKAASILRRIKMEEKE